jgi:uncharacterized protein YciI
MKHFSLITLFVLLGFHLFSQSLPLYYFVMLNSNPDKPKISEREVAAIQAAHRACIDSLANIGQLLAAGPFHGGGGLFILNAESPEAAQSMFISDPAVKANRFVIELYPLEMVIGSICPQKGGDYEMVEYQFIKYEPVKEKLDEASEKKFMKLNKRHTHFFSDNNFSIPLIAAGNFGSSNGGFLILPRTTREGLDRLLLYDPWTKSGYFTTELKSLWIAKGSFCEGGY